VQKELENKLLFTRAKYWIPQSKQGREGHSWLRFTKPCTSHQGASITFSSRNTDHAACCRVTALPSAPSQPINRSAGNCLGTVLWWEVLPWWWSFSDVFRDSLSRSFPVCTLSLLQLSVNGISIFLSAVWIRIVYEYWFSLADSRPQQLHKTQTCD